MLNKVPSFVLYAVLPYTVGLLFSYQNADLMKDIWFSMQGALAQQKTRTLTVMQDADLEACHRRLLQSWYQNQVPPSLDSEKDPFKGFFIVLHRNGEAIHCGETVPGLDLLAELKAVLATQTECPQAFDNKFQLDALLTRLFHALVPSCVSTQNDRHPRTGFYGHCDMGEHRTPILSDHHQLVPVHHVNQYSWNSERFLPCHFHDGQGRRVTSLSQLANFVAAPAEPQPQQQHCVNDNDPETCQANISADTQDERQVHLYAVPAGRAFMFAPSHVGEVIELPHVSGGDPSRPVQMRVLSVSPRVFDLINFFSDKESERLVAGAMRETRESHRIRRSSTGAVGYNVFSKRTSESGYDTSSSTAMAVKRRCFDVLGFDEYLESHADGLQILRYNLSTAYVEHMDWIDGSDELEHDFESSERGGNRFATILLYMTDLQQNDGGETVFPEAWPVGLPEESRVDLSDALRELQQESTENSSILKQGSWEEEMVAKCRTRLAVKPNKARAILFYSQFPNGTADPYSLHGGCPVLAGTKFAANLWVWNTPRQGYPGNPKNPKFRARREQQEEDVEVHAASGFVKCSATFRNSGNDEAMQDAELFYHDQFWGKLEAGGPPLGVNTYKGHVWNVKVNGVIVKTWTIADETEIDIVI